ncbi:hypothetical protein M8C17_00085 [Micromonospora sp. RHAY321]|uniref:hypothetical protein n=1 Tax=Micromonospora sp. RHAY321 TaxID=2944807 RepID=UPI00207D278B|nr:hypothetical protein [Micromonospora sp. RHAY321]MCO1593563.1 hypothetical protein [Micromonospora sp. RHAY321]
MIATMKAGDLVHLTRAASPQFVRPIRVRVIRELPERHTYPGWVWIEGYELGRAGVATEKRELFVLREGIELVSSDPPEAAPANTRQPVRRAQAGASR